jgi:hypothetical protein
LGAWSGAGQERKFEGVHDDLADLPSFQWSFVSKCLDVDTGVWIDSILLATEFRWALRSFSNARQALPASVLPPPAARRYLLAAAEEGDRQIGVARRQALLLIVSELTIGLHYRYQSLGYRRE